MSKIATELEAKTMGGGTLSVIDNKCCTKARVRLKVDLVIPIIS